MDHAGRTSAEQVRHEIDDQRTDLWSNLEALEHKFKSATNWQRQFRKNPMPLLGAAFGGGLCLAALMGRRTPHNYSYPVQTHAAAPTYAPRQQITSSVAKDKARDTWETAKGALIGVAATYFKKFAEEIIPGFGEQYDKAAGKTGSEAS